MSASGSGSFQDFQITTIGVTAAFVLLATSYIYRWLLMPSSIAKVPGPPSKSFVFGHLRELLKGEVGEHQFKWKEEYGGVVKFKGLLGEDCLLISDPRAMHYISNRPDEFTKHPVLKETALVIFGRGLVWADGDDHRRQRRINAPAFGANQLRAFIPFFYECASEITDYWAREVQTAANNGTVIDITRMISLGALDAIGKAAFDYEFDGIADADKPASQNELANCFRNLAHDSFGSPNDAVIFVQEAMGLMPAKLAGWFYDYMPLPALQKIRQVTKIGHDVSAKMIKQKGQELLTGKSKKDILSLLVQANAAPSDAKLKLSHEEMMATLHTLIIAGHETTATWMNWIMLELSRNPEVQDKLRKEVLRRAADVQERGDTMFNANDLEQGMPYLQAVLKETIRFHGPIYHHLKIPTVDSVVPLAAPITTTDGEAITSINIPKGTHLYLDIATFNRDPEMFGEDAHTWRPERFLNGEVNETAGLGGPYGSVMTFSAGPRTCIGWRFAVLEASVFIAEFVKNFQFELANPDAKIKREASLAMIPVIEGEEEKGHQLPLRFSLVAFDD